MQASWLSSTLASQLLDKVDLKAATEADARSGRAVFCRFRATSAYVGAITPSILAFLSTSE